MSSLVAVVGRPNVGKSTLVNRIATGQQAIVHSEPGVTRDRNYVPTDWGGRQFTLIDTGGLMLESAGGSDNGVIEGTVVEQALFAVKEADLVLFVVDGDSGLLAGDAEIARVLREAAKPALIVVNKIDAREKESHALEFYRLGLGDPLQVSAAHGLGIGDLLDELTKTLPEVDDPVPEVDVFARVAIVGRPNVGKSTLVNRLLGSERVIVHEEAGTTRDSVDTFLDHGGDRFCLVDTAGLKRRSKIARDVDYFGLVRTLRSLDRADCAVVLTDAVEGVTKQDLRIIGYAVERGAACVVAPNKIDLVDGPERQHIAGEARRKMPFLSYLPVLPISAEKGRGVNDLLGLVTEVVKSHRRRIKTPALNRFVQDMKAAGSPPASRGRTLNIIYATQAGTAPPVFVFFVNHPELAGHAYVRYISNHLRKVFGFEGVPIRVRVRRRRASRGGP